MACELNAKTAGGSPAASYLSCLAKKGNPKKSPPVCRPLGTLRCSTGQAAAELALRAQTVLADTPLTSLRYSAALRGKETKRFCVRYAHELFDLCEEGMPSSRVWFSGFAFFVPMSAASISRKRAGGLGEH